jgi:flagellar biosynthesis protein FliQ
MGPDQIVELAREMLVAALWLALPMLLIATLISLAINVVQVLTSLQETTLSTVPRLAAIAAAALVLMPWMVRRIGGYTLQLFSDFRPFLR